jgi:N6-L-threonylcarbamoyladenine synthase
LTTRWTNPGTAFPFLSLLVSGGHTLLLITQGVGDHSILGSTLDDAMGEAFDKVSRTLDIPWLPVGGAGAALEAMAAAGKPTVFGKHEWHSQIAFSFAGLKSQVARYVAALDPPYRGRTDSRVHDLAAAFQSTAIDHVVAKVALGLKECKVNGIHPTAMVISGGVAANQALLSA